MFVKRRRDNFVDAIRQTLMTGSKKSSDDERVRGRVFAVLLRTSFRELRRPNFVQI